MGKSLFDKVWDLHTVRELPGGQSQLLVGLHLIHEVTSPQAFGMLRDLGLEVMMPERTFATLDHIIPTDNRRRPFQDTLAEGMVRALKDACVEFDITFFDVESGRQGIVHIIGPSSGSRSPVSPSPAATPTPRPTEPSGPSPWASEPPRFVTSWRRSVWPWRG